MLVVPWGVEARQRRQWNSLSPLLLPPPWQGLAPAVDPSQWTSSCAMNVSWSMSAPPLQVAVSLSASG